MRRIALATCAHHPGFIANDDLPLLEVLRGRGADPSQPRWDDDEIDWSVFDGVVIRTTWDYQHKLDAFLRWVDRVGEQTVLLNPPDIIHANIRKTYLRTLEKADVPIVPTLWIAPGQPAPLEGLKGDVIIKPVIGASASGLLRVDAADVDAIRDHIASLEGEVLLQPFVSSIIEHGELSIVLIDGEITHAVRKAPAAGDFRVQMEYGGQYTVVEPTARETDVALRAMRALTPRTLAYARVDLIDVKPNEPAIGEVELIEPELFLPFVPSAAERLADVILASLR